ncbi:MAG: hypothetical protein PHW34_07735 [Hespellia sp.]|nr:hypothetical protein [Hespellia sp.]
MDMTAEQCKRFLNFIMGDDLDFYEEHLIDLTDEEQNTFFLDNPDFMSEFPVSRDRIYLLRDKSFRGILRKIKRYEGGKRDGKL